MSNERIPTSEKLALAMEAAGVPPNLVAKARNADYDDYRSEVSATPCVDLVRDLYGLASTADNPDKAARFMELRARAINGEFDAQKWESDAWAESMKDDPEMGPLLKSMSAGRQPFS